MDIHFIDPNCKILESVKIYDTVNKVPNEISFQWKNTLKQNEVIVERAWNKNPVKGEHSRSIFGANSSTFMTITTTTPYKTLIFNYNTLCSNTSMVDDLISKKKHFDILLFDQDPAEFQTSELTESNINKLFEAELLIRDVTQEQIDSYIDTGRLEDVDSINSEMSNYSLKNWYVKDKYQNFYNIKDLERNNFYSHYQEKKIGDFLA